MIQLVDTIKKYSEESAVARREKRDCVVRCFASAFEVDYIEAHQWLRNKFGRKDKRGTMGTAAKLNLIDNHFGYKIKNIGIEWSENLGVKKYVYKKLLKVVNKKKNLMGGYTVGSFLKEYGKGTFIVIVSRHAFTIKDGVIYGNKSDERMRVRIKYVFELEKLCQDL